jgi:hypothetical protein
MGGCVVTIVLTLSYDRAISRVYAYAFAHTDFMDTRDYRIGYSIQIVCITTVNSIKVFH